MTDIDETKKQVYELAWNLFKYELAWNLFKNDYPYIKDHKDMDINAFIYYFHQDKGIDEWTILTKIMPTYIECQSEHCSQMIVSDVINGKKVHQIAYKGTMYYPIQGKACENFWESILATLKQIADRPALTCKWGEI